jgi:hypothetical protein
MASKIHKICSLCALTIVAGALAAFSTPVAAQYVYWNAVPNTTLVTLKENGQSATVTYTFTNVSPYDLWFIQTAPSLNYVLVVKIKRKSPEHPPQFQGVLRLAEGSKRLILSTRGSHRRG